MLFSYGSRAFFLDDLGSTCPGCVVQPEPSVAGCTTEMTQAAYSASKAESIAPARKLAPRELAAVSDPGQRGAPAYMNTPRPGHAPQSAETR